MLPVSLRPRAADPVRGRIDRVSARVLTEMVEIVVTGTIRAGDVFPSEHTLCEEFGVSRTVVRECVKRLQEKGLIVVARGYGARVMDSTNWNVLDPEVFDALVRHDRSLGVLDEVSVLRGALEGMMTAEVASTGTAEFLDEIAAHLDHMRSCQHDRAAFLDADMSFHLALMTASRNRIAATIAHSLFVRPRQSERWDGLNPPDAHALTVREHERVVAAIQARDPGAAREAMEEHILAAWRRRRMRDGESHITP